VSWAGDSDPPTVRDTSLNLSAVYMLAGQSDLMAVRLYRLLTYVACDGGTGNVNITHLITAYLHTYLSNYPLT
jgi:hypothetical protein